MISDGVVIRKKQTIRKMFDSIVPGYDFLNSFLSLGLDHLWRRRLISEAGSLKNRRVLDICSGTGALSSGLVKQGAALTALDFSVAMLRKGISGGRLGPMPLAADAAVMPFKVSVFDVQTIAFGIRNIPDIETFLKEVRRTLKPGGRLLILELTRPANPVIRAFYSFYLRNILPVAGGIVSGNFRAYRYLSATILDFIEPEMLKRIIIDAGFINVKIIPLTRGISTLIVCEQERQSMESVGKLR